MKKLRANVCTVSHAGKVRRENEDNYNLNGRSTANGELRKGSAYVQNLTEPFFMAACDGMGGESYGELASGVAVTTLTRHANSIYDSGDEFAAAISNCLNDCNARICAEMKERGKRLGTTLAAMFAVQGRCICTNIGDTRIYRYSKGILEQMSIDHTHAQTIVDSGEVPMDRIKSIPEANRLTRHLGVFADEAKLAPNIFVMDDIEDGDIILMCSDGLTDMVPDEMITHILSVSESAQEAASNLVRKALENGGKDNITVIVGFMGVEQTAIFTPIAKAMVGDRDADYEDEYMVSYKHNKPDAPAARSPYENVDSNAAKGGKIDKTKLIMLICAGVGALLLIVLLAFGIKALVGGRDKDDEATSSTTLPTTTQDVYVWSSPDYSLTTEESTTEESTSTSTTRKRTTTTTRRNTTTTTTQRSTTTTTTRADSTTDTTATTATTQPTTDAATTTTQAATTTTEPASTTSFIGGLIDALTPTQPTQPSTPQPNPPEQPAQ